MINKLVSRFRFVNIPFLHLNHRFNFSTSGNINKIIQDFKNQLKNNISEVTLDPKIMSIPKNLGWELIQNQTTEMRLKKSVENYNVEIIFYAKFRQADDYVQDQQQANQQAQNDQNLLQILQFNVYLTRNNKNGILFQCMLNKDQNMQLMSMNYIEDVELRKKSTYKPSDFKGIQLYQFEQQQNKQNKLQTQVENIFQLLGIGQQIYEFISYYSQTKDILIFNDCAQKIINFLK